MCSLNNRIKRNKVKSARLCSPFSFHEVLKLVSELLCVQNGFNVLTMSLPKRYLCV